MKPSSSIFCLLLLCSIYSVKAQNILPSTVRQIFNLEKGDVLEYREWTVATGCGTICDWYELKTVDSINYSSSLDTMFIFFQTELVRVDTGAPVSMCGQCQQEFLFGDICPIYTSKWVLTNLDSSIVSFLNSAYYSHFSRDSVYANNQVYNGSKQNWYSVEGNTNFISNTEEIYVDSVGIVFKMVYYENRNTNAEQLIYYHKANGKTWGAPFFEVGVDDVFKKEICSVYPNPTDGRFIIYTSLYQGMHFLLFDALSRPVMNLNLSGNETEADRSNLSPGIYFWQVTNGRDIIKTGKLVMK